MERDVEARRQREEIHRQETQQLIAKMAIWKARRRAEWWEEQARLREQQRENGR